MDYILQKKKEAEQRKCPGMKSLAALNNNIICPKLKAGNDNEKNNN